ncbi:MAG: endonuclease/exonuclease/phosphatase family protein [Chitinophagaceae bacterium]
MKFITLVFFLCQFLLSNGQNALNVMTFNIRYNNKSDSLNAWPYRKDFAASQVLFHEVNILGVQEALADQIKDLEERMPGYTRIGGGREDGKEKGEFSAIFIDASRLEILDSKMFWLAEKTDVPGLKGWDAAITRMVTWAKLKDRKTKKIFYIFNTHFDHMGAVARRESAKLVLEKINEIAGKLPVILTGDFNSKPTDEPIKILTAVDNPMHVFDTKAFSKMPHYGPTGTFTAFRAKETSDDPIDYIFFKNKVTVLQHATLSQSWKGHFSSDHFPVFARVIID